MVCKLLSHLCRCFSEEQPKNSSQGEKRPPSSHVFVKRTDVPYPMPHPSLETGEPLPAHSIELRQIPPMTDESKKVVDYFCARNPLWVDLPNVPHNISQQEQAITSLFS